MRFLGKEEDVPLLGDELFQDYDQLWECRTAWDEKNGCMGKHRPAVLVIRPFQLHE